MIILGRTRTKDKYRVVYSDHQRLELEKEFHYSRYITIRRKAELANSVGLSERQVRLRISSLKVSSAALALHESSEWSANASTWVTRTLLDVVPLENFSLKTHLFCSLQMLYLYFFSATQMQYCCHHKLNTSFSSSGIWIFAPKIKLKILGFLYFEFKNSNVSLIILEIMGKND